MNFQSLSPGWISKVRKTEMIHCEKGGESLRKFTSPTPCLKPPNIAETKAKIIAITDMAYLQDMRERERTPIDNR